MKITPVDFNLVEGYLEQLKNLSPENRRELISRLSATINGDVGKDQPPLVKDLYGSFMSSKTADEIISEIKDRRTIHRKVETL